MSTIHIDWSATPSGSKRLKEEMGENTFFPRVKDTNVVSDMELYRIAARDSVMHRGMYNVAAEGLARAIAQVLLSGNTVSISSLGTFSLKLGTKGKVTRKDWADMKAIQVCGINFTPSDEMMKILEDAEFQWVPSLSDECILTEEQMYSLLQEWFESHTSITRREFSELFHVSRHVALAKLNRFVQLGWIVKSGMNRSTIYVPKKM